MSQRLANLANRADQHPAPVSGEVRLVAAFWQAVHDDLGSPWSFTRCQQTVQWVMTSPKFAFWCELSGSDADTVRAHLQRCYPAAFQRFAPPGAR